MICDRERGWVLRVSEATVISGLSLAEASSGGGDADELQGDNPRPSVDLDRSPALLSPPEFRSHIEPSGVEWPLAVFDSGQGRLQVGDGDAEVMLVSGDEADRLLGCTYEFQMRVTWTECRARRGVRRTQLLEVQASVWGADGGPGLDEIQGVVDLGARCCVLPSCR